MHKILFFIFAISNSVFCASAVGDAASVQRPLCFTAMPEDPARHIAFLEDAIQAAEINMALLKLNQLFAFSDLVKTTFQTFGQAGVDLSGLEQIKLEDATRLYALVLSPYQVLCRELVECLKSRDTRKYAELLENIVYVYVDFYDFNKNGAEGLRRSIQIPAFANLNSIYREQIGDLFTPFISSESFHFKKALEKKETTDRLVGRLKRQFPDVSAAQILCETYDQQMRMLETSSLCGIEIGVFKRRCGYEMIMAERLKERKQGYKPQQIAINSEIFSSVIDSYAQGADGKRSLYPFVMNCGYFLAESLIPFVRFIEAQEAKRKSVQEKRARHIALMASGQRVSLEKIEERRRGALLREADFLRTQLYESIFGVLSGQRERDDCAQQFRLQVEEEQLRLAVEEKVDLLFAQLSDAFFADYPYQFVPSQVEFVPEQKSLENTLDVRRSLFQKTKLYDVLESLKEWGTVKQPRLINAMNAFGKLVPKGGSEHDIIFWSYDRGGQKIEHKVPHFDLRHGSKEAEYRREDVSGNGALVVLIKKLKEVGYLE